MARSSAAQKVKIIQARIRKAASGWILAPQCENGLSMLSRVYGGHYVGLQGRLAFAKDDTFCAALNQLRAMCRKSAVGVRIAANDPELAELWYLPPAPGPHDTFYVSHGKRCWPASIEAWANDADAFPRMSQAFDGDGPAVMVHAAPSLSGISADAVVSHGTIYGRVFASWRETEPMSRALGTMTSKEMSSAMPVLPLGGAMIPGVETQFVRQGPSLEDLMRVVSAEEQAFIKYEAARLVEVRKSLRW